MSSVAQRSALLVPCRRPSLCSVRRVGALVLALGSYGWLLGPISAHVAQASEDTRGAIRGRVQVHGTAHRAHERPAVAALGMAPAHAAPDRSRCVVYLENAPEGAPEAPPAARATLDQRGEAFIPYVLAIPVGTTVDFPNHDLTYHNVFSLSKAKRFDLGRYPRGQSRSVRFDRPGVVRVFCEIHSHMSAYVIVFAHRFFAVTDEHGRFEIPAVLPGRYSVAVWHDGEVRARRDVTLTDEDRSVTVNLEVE